MYGGAQQGRVTLLNELPDLEDLDRNEYNDPHAHQGTQVHQGLPPENYQKFIRSPHQMAQGSGMERYASGPPSMREGYGPPNPGSPHATMNYEEMYNGPPQDTQPQQYMAPMLNCLDVNGHITGCPICSRFYNNDKTVYIIIIIILAIICLLLMKRVLNV